MGGSAARFFTSNRQETHSCGASPVVVTGLNPLERITVPKRPKKKARAAAAYTSTGSDVISVPACARSKDFH